MGQSGTIVVCGAVHKDLGLVFQSAERFGVYDAVAVALKVDAAGVPRLGKFASTGLGTLRSVGGKVGFLEFLSVLFSIVSRPHYRLPSMLEKTVKSEIAYRGLIFDVERIDIECANGRPAKRDVIRHNGAVGVIARKPDGAFVFVKQYRKAIEQVTLECVAGTLEKGEDPSICAERELAEETGYQAGELVHLGRVCPSPGYLDEKIEIYFTEITGEAQAEQDEDEHCEPVELTREEIEAAIDAGEIIDSKTLAAWLLFLRKGER